jgi:GT2 family glycosyltransferase
VGLVVIGRNEGRRLEACLLSVRADVVPVVYVDSGSTDGSVERARELGAHVVELDMSMPFTAARARNEGFAQLMQSRPELRYVQFVDGDCEMCPGWLQRGAAALDQLPHAAIVAGRVRERHREATVYNRLCDMEWNTQPGVVSECGGIHMVRAEVFERAGGFNPSLIAGEEPELCVRLRRAGWQIVRVDADMALHDAAMTRFGQWWKRSVRSGYAYAEAMAMHGLSSQRHGVRESLRIWWWALAPALLVAGSWPWCGPWALLWLLGYDYLAMKIFLHRRRHGDDASDAALYAVFHVLVKFPQLLGQLRYGLGRLSGRRSGIIEYKKPA